jgi:hypothetical protein
MGTRVTYSCCVSLIEQVHEKSPGFMPDISTRKRLKKVLVMTTENSSTSICDLLEDVTTLRTRIADQGQRIFAAFEEYLQRDDFRDSALNLAHYLALRRYYLHELQFKLMQIQ